MRSTTILKAMLDNGFLDAEAHNPNDYITYVTKAAKQLDALLDGVKSPDVADVVAAMFANGFCTRDGQADPNEWIMYAEAAVAELKVV